MDVLHAEQGPSGDGSTDTLHAKQGSSGHGRTDILPAKQDASGNGSTDILPAKQDVSGDGSLELLPAKQDVSGESSVELLPDEILTMIFGKLSDGTTLLDVLPLVCKRWYRVARDPSSWAGAELTLGDDLDRETRILLHAPAAKSLLIYTKVLFRQHDDTVRSCYSRSRAQIRSITAMPTGRSLSYEYFTEDPIGVFLGRQRELQQLRLSIFTGESILYRHMSKLHRIQKLRITTEEVVAYRGDLAGAMPELRELAIYTEDHEHQFRKGPPPNLIGDLVRGATALRVLNIDVPSYPDDEACLQLRGLEHLTLNVYKDDRGISIVVGERAVPVVREAFEFLLKFDTSAMRTATITLCRGKHAKHSDAMRARCKALLDEYAPQIPHVEVDIPLGGPDCEDCLDAGTNYCNRKNWPVCPEEWVPEVILMDYEPYDVFPHQNTRKTCALL